ncbi:MAG: hypothetical protein KDE55_06270 [Novosphingobium sp.]|nr:hypothetical protein [Novosphingobium sp.]
MRPFSGFIATLLALLAITTPATARAATEKVIVLGKPYMLKPVDMEAPARPWAEVRQYLPASATRASGTALTDEQVLAEIERQAAAHGDRIEKLINPLTDRYLPQFLRSQPGANWDWFNLELAGACYQGETMGYIPQGTVRVCLEYQALDNLREMLRMKLGKSDYGQSRY